jgi:hypothetical protein
MGKILPAYRKAVIDEIIDNVFSNTSQYYAFAANPVAYVGTTPAIVETDYSTMFINDWQMLFGKKLTAADIVPVIDKNSWVSNTVYNRYDNTSNTLMSNNGYYVVTNPIVEGASYNVYKCIDNANGGFSTVDPGTIGTPTQVSTFQTSDGYKWKYIYSISEMNYVKFSSENYVPVYTNSTISSTASSYGGVEVVMISNSGSGYVAYTNGTIRSVQNSTVVQIENDASSSDNYYVNNGIYIYNSIEATSQLRIISDYVANSSGKFVFVSLPLDTATISPGISNYLISPAVVFESDGTVDPKAYSLVNSSNSISNVVILDIGSNISWANVKIQSSFGSGANVYAIVPPPGGHGFDPATELEVKGFAAAFNFANTENDNIPTANVLYNKIGLIKNPYALSSNTTTGIIGKGAKYFANTFNQVLTANITPTHLFTVGETVIGSNSGARGTVVFSNTTQVHISGDKYFVNGESIANLTSIVGTITINRVGDIYTKDLKPIYIDNINNVNRSDTQTEVFKLTIEI